MESYSLTTVLLATTILVYAWRWLRPGKDQLPNIPTMGPSAPILTYWGAIQFLLNGIEITKQGYEKFKGRAFKVPMLNHWLVVVCSPQLVEELRKAPDDALSFMEATNESLEIEYTAGSNIATNLYHVPIVRGNLTRNLPVLFPAIQDEIVTASHDSIPSSEEWCPVPAYDMIVQVVARTSNRLFVGLPFCRNPGFIKLSIRYTMDLVMASNIITNFPSFLKPYAARFLTRVPASVDEGVQYLGEEVQRRLDLWDLHGPDYPDKPNDMLSWLIDAAEGEERTVRNLVLRLLVLGFAAIHTSSMSFTHALYHLADRPDYVDTLREEIESVIKAEGWSKNAMEKMYKVDSFLKECQRTYALGGVTMNRKALKDFTFSDGTFIPKGTIVGSPVLELQRDPDFYENPDAFNPWRFYEDRLREGDSGKHAMVSTSVEYHPFGHGRHACPGRFFAANELKMLLVHLVTNYDMKSEKEGVIPPPLVFGVALVPNNKAKVLFRKRRAA